MKSKTFAACIFGMLLVVCSGCARQSGYKQRTREQEAALYQLALIELQSAGQEGGCALRRALDLTTQLTHGPIARSAQMLQSTLYIRLGQFDQALACLQKLIDCEQGPSARAQLVNNYACVLAARGQRNKAHRLWQRLVRDSAYTTPECAWFNLGSSYIAQGNADRACYCFKQAVDIEPSYAAAHAALAQVCQLRGEVQQADWHFTVAQQVGLQDRS